VSSVHSRAQSCRATVMVVVKMMRVVENCDHEFHSVLQKGVKAQISSSVNPTRATLTPRERVGHS